MQRMMTAISRTMRKMDNTSFSMPTILEEQCSIVGANFEKTSALLVDMYPVFYFTFNAEKFRHSTQRVKKSKKQLRPRPGRLLASSAFCGQERKAEMETPAEDLCEVGF